MDLNTLGGIRQICREMFVDESNGHADDQLVSDELWNFFINEAQDDAARAGRMIIDDRNGDVCSGTITLDDPWVTLNENVLEILKVKLASTGRYLYQRGFGEMESRSVGWSNWTDYGQWNGSRWEIAKGIPRYFVPNMDSLSIRVVPIPTANDALWMTVFRLPKARLSADTDVPEIPRQYRMAIVHRALYRAHMKDDTETLNLNQSQTHDLKYLEIVERAKEEMERKRRAPRSTGIAYGGIR